MFLSFRLAEEFVDTYTDRPVQWGFPIGGGNSLGELTFLTKYGRRKADGSKERLYCRSSTSPFAAGSTRHRPPVVRRPLGKSRGDGNVST